MYLFCFRCALLYCVFVYDDANYVTVPHTGPTGDTWKWGCDRLVSEPTLSELNTILMCLISVTQLHIPRFSSLDKELRKCSNISFNLFLLFIIALSYIFCCATCLTFDRITMPPRMRGRGGFATSHDHEAGPSHRRAPSATHNTAANDLWRSFAEPARHSVSASTSPSLPQSFGPHSENGPHGSHGSYIPLHQSPHQYPAPAYQGLYNPDAYLDEPVGHNPLGPEDHFSGGHEMDVDEDSDPSLPPSGTPNHPIEISDGSPFTGSPFNGVDSYEERFRQHDWYFTPSHHNSPMLQSLHGSPVHSQHRSPQLQQQPPLQQDLSEALWRDVITPSPPPPPPVLPPPPQRPRRNARMSTRGGICIGTLHTLVAAATHPFTRSLR
ncbi:hypothetical protein Hdeb2414_s0001g00042071 [Helianthus debilis subsp. tardiflorus]